MTNPKLGSSTLTRKAREKRKQNRREKGGGGGEKREGCLAHLSQSSRIDFHG